jgi:hypothetical protein
MCYIPDNFFDGTNNDNPTKKSKKALCERPVLEKPAFLARKGTTSSETYLKRGFLPKEVKEIVDTAISQFFPGLTDYVQVTATKAPKTCAEGVLQVWGMSGGKEKRKPSGPASDPVAQLSNKKAKNCTK